MSKLETESNRVWWIAVFPGVSVKLIIDNFFIYLLYISKKASFDNLIAIPGMYDKFLLLDFLGLWFFHANMDFLVDYANLKP